MNSYQFFTTNFRKKEGQRKNIGLEIEMPIVTQTGKPVNYHIIRSLFLSLQQQGFELIKEDGIIVEAEIYLKDNSQHKTIVTTDLGYSTLEIVLPPCKDLHVANQCFKAVLDYLLPFIKKENCRLLGYGVHPLAQPSRQLITPKQRYYSLEKIWNRTDNLPKSIQRSTHLLTVSAGNQCHIDVTEREAVMATNVLNASSGLQIVLQANSPIWRGKVAQNYKAVRERFYDFLFDKKLQRHGVAPKFETLMDYFQHLTKQTLFLVIRNNEVLQISDYNFAEYLEQKTVEATNFKGDKITITPVIGDLHYHNTLCYLNARLVPNYGTIEVRMPCQQPPNETMVTAALNLGLMENLVKANTFFEKYDWSVWKHLRAEAMKHAFQAKLPNGKSIIPLIEEFLTIAQKGLKNRKHNEEKFLNPLFERLKKQESPADVAIDIFNKKGMTGLLDAVSFTETSALRTQETFIRQTLSN